MVEAYLVIATPAIIGAVVIQFFFFLWSEQLAGPLRLDRVGRYVRELAVGRTDPQKEASFEEEVAGFVRKSLSKEGYVELHRLIPYGTPRGPDLVFKNPDGSATIIEAKTNAKSIEVLHQLESYKNLAEQSGLTVRNVWLVVPDRTKVPKRLDELLGRARISVKEMRGGSITDRGQVETGAG